MVKMNLLTFLILCIRMAECPSGDCGVTINDFVRTGRTGRRNALPDVFSLNHANVSTAGLPEVLENFTLETSAQTSEGTRNSQVQPPAEKM